MSPFTRYMLFQLPGWLLVGVLLLWIWPGTGLSPWLAATAFAVYVAKDFVLYPFLRKGYETRVATGTAQLIGARGVARDPLDPQGFVRIGGELWRARIEPGSGAIEAGTEIRVERAEGLTLWVSAAGDRPGSEHARTDKP